MNGEIGYIAWDRANKAKTYNFLKIFSFKIIC